MIRSRASVLAAALALTAGLVACSDDPDERSTPDGRRGSRRPPSDGDVSTVSFVLFGDPTETAGYETLAEQFEARERRRRHRARTGGEPGRPGRDAHHVVRRREPTRRLLDQLPGVRPVRPAGRPRAGWATTGRQRRDRRGRVRPGLPRRLQVRRVRAHLPSAERLLPRGLLQRRHVRGGRRRAAECRLDLGGLPARGAAR